MTTGNPYRAPTPTRRKIVRHEARTVSFHLDQNDLWALYKHIMLSWKLFALLALGYVFPVLFAFLNAGLPDPIWLIKQMAPVYIFLTVLYILFFLGLIYLVKVVFYNRLAKTGRNQYTVELTPGHLREITPVNDSKYLWRGVKAPYKKSQYYIFRLEAFAIIPVPLRAFEDLTQAETFFERAKEYQAAATPEEKII